MNRISRRSWVTAGLGLVILAAWVGIGSRQSVLGPGGPAPPREPFEVLAQTAFYLGLALDVLLMAGLVYAFWPQGRGKKKGEEDVLERVVEPLPLPWTVKLALLLLPFVVLSLMVGLIVVASHVGSGSIGQVSGPTPGIPATPTQTELPPTNATGAAAGVLPWISAGLAALVVLFSLLVWLIRERRLRAPWQGSASDGPESVSDAIDEGLEALLSHPDPRQAVIRAYSAMERALARAGRVRWHFEAPLEFVGRILSSIPGAAADARRLTELFELAKFSQHEIDSEMRDVAVMTLSNIRRQLQAPA